MLTWIRNTTMKIKHPSLEPDGEWKLLLKPYRYASYINDHTIFKVGSKWRLLGTCAKGDYKFFRERFFIKGKSNSLDREMKEVGTKFKKLPHSGIKIAPHVYYDKQSRKYHLYFASAFTINHFHSDNGEIWWKAPAVVRSWWPATRDPYVVKIKSKYAMYLTDFGNKISVYTSKDLFKWKKKGVAFRLGNEVPRSLNSSCESSTIFKFGDWYLLLTTITPAPEGRRYNYTRTIAFCSKNPYDFGTYSEGDDNTTIKCGVLEAHAPEVIKDGGNLYITTCGWRGFPKPVGVDGEGVYIRRLTINV